MTSVENLDFHSPHTGMHYVDADPDRFEWPRAIEFVNAETTSIRDIDFSDDPVLRRIRSRLGMVSVESEILASQAESV